VGPVSPVVRTTDGLAQIEGITPRHYHGGHMDAAAAAVVEIRDGSAAGAVIDTLRLGAAGETDGESSERGVVTANGVWVEVVSGTPTVTVYVS
jgi:hypothetical protein